MDKEKIAALEAAVAALIRGLEKAKDCTQANFARYAVAVELMGEDEFDTAKVSALLEAARAHLEQLRRGDVDETAFVNMGTNGGNQTVLHALNWAGTMLRVHVKPGACVFREGEGQRNFSEVHDMLLDAIATLTPKGANNG